MEHQKSDLRPSNTNTTRANRGRTICIACDKILTKPIGKDVKQGRRKKKNFNFYKSTFSPKYRISYIRNILIYFVIIISIQE